MGVKESCERLLGEGFTAQERERLTRLRDDYAKRGFLDLAEGDRHPGDDRQTGRSDGLNRRVMKDRASTSIHRSLGLLLIVISAVSFGIMPILARFAYAAGADPIAVLVLRFCIAAIVMIAIMLARKELFPRGRTLLGLILMGAVGYAGVSLAYFTALTMARASLVALLLYLYPALVTILSVVFLKEQLGFIKRGALFLALAGTALTVGLTGGGSAPGIMLGIGAALLYAIYILAGSHVVHQARSIASSTLVMISAATAYAGIAVVHGSAFPQTVVGWAAVVAIALVSTVLAFVTFFAGLKQVGPITASTLSTWEPGVTVVLATLVLGERMGLLQLLGGVLILLAAVVLMREETARKKPRASPHAV
jgi:drug/metabolite transporter (DMT)-like permease